MCARVWHRRCSSPHRHAACRLLSPLIASYRLLSPLVAVAAPVDKLRELLIWQLVSGYKLRELEVRDEMKDRFWGPDGKKD